MNHVRRACELAIAALEGDASKRTEAILALEQLSATHGRLRRVVYHSVSLMSRDGLDALLQQARVSNAELGITGALMHWSNEIVQVLEGPDEPLSYLLATIRHDRRHKHFNLLSSGLVEHRQFGDWLMASAELQPDDFAAVVAGFAGDEDRTLRKVAAWASGF